MSLLAAEHVVQGALEPIQNLGHAGQRRALLPILQPIQCGFGQPQPLCKGIKRGLSPFLTKELRQLLVKPSLHATGIVPESLFRMRNKWIALGQPRGYETSTFRRL